MEILNLTFTAWSSLIGALSMAVLAGVMLILGTKRLHYIWAAFSIAVFIYAIGFYSFGRFGWRREREKLRTFSPKRATARRPVRPPRRRRKQSVSP